MAETRSSDAELLRQIRPARKREQAARRQGHRACGVRFDRANARVVLELSSGILFAFPVGRIAALRGAPSAALAKVEVSASGSVVRWDALDVDLSVAGLLLSAVDPGERIRHLAAHAGRVTSAVKAAAARANGMKGGRPRKVVSGAQPVASRRKAVV